MSEFPMDQQGKRLAILVGGGPAPGINGVIRSATIQAINSGLRVLGIYDGFEWLMEGDASMSQSFSSKTCPGFTMRADPSFGLPEPTPANLARSRRRWFGP